MSHFAPVTAVLVDLNNFAQEAPRIYAAIQAASLIGLDIETSNHLAHPGVQAMNKNKKVVFDVKRTHLCGLSIWPDGSPVAWYFNLGHADTTNALPWDAVKPLLDAKPKTSRWVVHNLTFEMVMLAETVGWELSIDECICTLQMAVSAYGPDEYDFEKFCVKGLDGFANLIPAIRVACAVQVENPDMLDLLQKVIGKQSDAAHSYNGWVSEIAYGYGLKKAVKSFFDHEMTTYEQCLRGRPHMAALTGEETVSYAAEDAIWCVRLYHRLLKFMLDTNPSVVKTYFEQELPMVQVYASTWREGVRIDAEAVRRAEVDNRVKFADCVRRLKAAIKTLLPFDPRPHEGLHEVEEWYRKNVAKYRAGIMVWANMPDVADDFIQATQVRGAIPNEWARERGVAENKNGLNLGHYMPVRVIMYDLFRAKVMMEQGKVQSDANARGRLMERLRKQGNDKAVEVLSILGEMASIEQASKLYLAPYQKLVDPDTGKLHPQVGSELATRRLSMKEPNPTQLAKRGQTVYVRGFYKPDHDDHVIVSLDFSQIELVTGGELSGDEGFLSVYRQLPYKDLHEICAAGLLEVSLDTFRNLRSPDVADHPPHLLVNTKGERMEPSAAYKYWRTELGKGGNFESAYGNILATVGQRMGWDQDKTLAMTDRHKATFPRYWEWKSEVIQETRLNGLVTLRDNHRRVRFEATPEWAGLFRDKWARMHDPSLTWFAEKAIRRIQTRAGNQAVNALIQGLCAALMKRSVLGSVWRFKERGWSSREARFMFSVHDELVFSVRRDLVTEVISEVRAAMLNHSEFFKQVVLDCSPSVGLTYAPWDAKKARLGQIELNEAPDLPFVEREQIGKALRPEQWQLAVDWLFEEAAQ